MFNYLIKLYKETPTSYIYEAAKNGKIDFIKKTLNIQSKKKQKEELKLAIQNMLVTPNYLSEEESEKVFRFLLDMYLALDGKRKKVFKYMSIQDIRNKNLIKILKEYSFKI